MPKVTFTRDYDYPLPGKPSVVAYLAGWSGDVPKAHALAATQAGALAEPFVDPPKGDAAKGGAAT